MTCHQMAPCKLKDILCHEMSPNIIMCHEMSPCQIERHDIWWHFMTYGDFSWLNMLFIMICHDMSGQIMKWLHLIQRGSNTGTTMLILQPFSNISCLIWIVDFRGWKTYKQPIKTFHLKPNHSGMFWKYFNGCNRIDSILCGNSWAAPHIR